MYTPHEIGFWSEPDMEAFAQEIKNPDAGAAISRLREYIMVRGHNDDRLPGHSREKIAAIMKPPKTCSLDRFFKALEKYGFLKRQRKTYFVPDWKKSPAGQYCLDRVKAAARKADWRRRQDEAAMEAMEEEIKNGTRPGQDRSATVAGSGHSAVSKKGEDGDSPPLPPEGGSVGRADARWQWFKDLYPRLRNPPKCQRLLANLDDENWKQLQGALPRQREIYMSRGKRWVPWADKYLETQQFWELGEVAPRKSDAKTGGKKDVALADPTPEQKKAAGLKFLREQLTDPDLADKLKDKAKQHWREKYNGEEPWTQWRQPQKAKAAALSPSG